MQTCNDVALLIVELPIRHPMPRHVDADDNVGTPFDHPGCKFIPRIGIVQESWKRSGQS